MGTFRVRIEVGGPDLERFEPVEALVDTGATYTVLPRPLLQELGIAAHTRAPFVLADGREVEAPARQGVDPIGRPAGVLARCLR